VGRKRKKADNEKSSDREEKNQGKNINLKVENFSFGMRNEHNRELLTADGHDFFETAGKRSPDVPKSRQGPMVQSAFNLLIMVCG
jgi:hypothetical protein